MATIFRGTLDPKLQRRVIQYSPSSGYTQNWDYKGFGENLMLSLMSSYTNQGCEVTFTGEHGVYTLQVKDSTGTTTLDTWQIQNQTMQLSRTRNPKLIAATSETTLRVVARAISDSTTVTAAAAAIQKEIGGTVTAPSLGSAGNRTISGRIFDTMKDGFTSYDRSTYVLRHTTNAPSNYGSNVADFNVDCIYTTSQLLSETQNSNYWLLPLPGALAYFIQGADAAMPAAPAGYTNGWFKFGSSRSTAANNRIEINTEYMLGQHSADDYYNAV
jgi:hypothetical protein